MNMSIYFIPVGITGGRVHITLVTGDLGDLGVTGEKIPNVKVWFAV